MDSRPETHGHILRVQENIKHVIIHLMSRMLMHDISKLESPELEVFDKVSGKLRETTYMSKEYQELLDEMEPALKHHYKYNRHHPQFFKNGISGMNLIDLVEMIADWSAAIRRHPDGDIRKSIEINKERFGYGDELKQILLNTVEFLGL